MITYTIKENLRHIEILLFIYVIAIPINGVLNIPYLETRIQLTEIVLPILTILTLNIVIKNKTWQKYKLTIIDKALIAFGIAMFLSFLSHPTKISFIKIIGFIDIGILYLIINIYFLESGKNIRNFLVKSTKISAILTILVSFVGLILIYFSIKNPLLGYYKNYPIFGSIYRMKAWTMEPLYLMSFLGVCTLIFIAGIFSKPKNIFSFTNVAIIIVSTIIMISTLTKSFIMLIASFIVVIAVYFNKLNTIKKVLWLVLFTVFMFFTHYSFVSKTYFNKNELYEGLIREPIAEFGDKYLLLTVYGFQKKSNIIVFSRFPFLGIGHGNFSKYMEQLKKDNLYPSYFANYDPISTYFGALSELGIIGFVSLIFFFSTLFWAWVNITKLKNIDNNEQNFWILLVGVILFMFAEGFVTDTIYYRHYWLIYSCIAAQGRNLLY